MTCNERQGPYDSVLLPKRQMNPRLCVALKIPEKLISFLHVFFFDFCEYIFSGRKGRSTSSQQRETFQPIHGTTDRIAVECF